MSLPTKRLAIFFDGTDNQPKDRTNVWRTHELMAEVDPDGVPQKKIYIEGVGTDLGHILTGSIFGSGVSRRIREGYAWLVEHFEEGAEIYIFGFSRGAFAARSLVQFIATCGLVRKSALGDWSVGQAFDHYEAITVQDAETKHPIWRLRYWGRHPEETPAGWSPSQQDKYLLDDSKVAVVKVRMAGLWDTVGALGADALKNQVVQTQKAATHNVRPTRAQEFGYHALAVDEHRPMFEVTLWRTFSEAGKEAETLARYQPYYEQRWFIGAHSDVGGGYGDDRLPDQSLAWMLEKAKGLGLSFTQAVEPQPDSWKAPIHDSFKRFAGGVLSIWDKVVPGDQRNYREVGRVPRPVNTSTGQIGSLLSINETIDETVIKRWMEDPLYRPPGLVQYFRRNPGERPAGTTLD